MDMQTIERQACAYRQATGHNLEGPTPRPFRTHRRSANLAAWACLVTVVGVLVAVGAILGAI